MIKLHQRIRQCLNAVRAEAFEADSEETTVLGYFLKPRSNGLMIETPTVRY